MTETAKHAIMVGASLGGLCAARVLSNVYDRVTVYERDHLPDVPARLVGRAIRHNMTAWARSRRSPGTAGWAPARPT